jgi:hypothetical protein
MSATHQTQKVMFLRQKKILKEALTVTVTYFDVIQTFIKPGNSPTINEGELFLFLVLFSALYIIIFVRSALSSSSISTAYKCVRLWRPNLTSNSQKLFGVRAKEHK